MNKTQNKKHNKMIKIFRNGLTKNNNKKQLKK